MPPSVDASSQEALQALWAGAGLEGITASRISVERRFTNLQELWSILLQGPSAGQILATLPVAQQDQIRNQLAERWNARGEEPVTLRAQANAIRGMVPATGC